MSKNSVILKTGADQKVIFIYVCVCIYIYRTFAACSYELIRCAYVLVYMNKYTDDIHAYTGYSTHKPVMILYSQFTCVM
jgi:hypothetical protein